MLGYGRSNKLMTKSQIRYRKKKRALQLSSQFITLINNYAGDTDDWPIRVHCDDRDVAEAYNLLCKAATQSLSEAGYQVHIREPLK